MPTKEAIVPNSPIPQQVEKPIPTRTVTTRLQRTEPQIAGQPASSASPVADSTNAEESVRLSPQLTVLARKEQAFRQREQALKDREKELETKLSKADRFETLEQKFSAKDFSEAEALGLNYEEYTKYVLDKQGEKDPAVERMAQLEAEIAAMKAGQEESAASQYEETIAEYRKEIGKALTSNPDFSSVQMLESINGVKGEDAVMQLIIDSFEQDDIELSVEDACKQVEDYVYSFGKKLTELPKFKQTVKEEVEPQRVLPRPMVGKTLTNDMNTVTEKRPYKSLQHLSEAERYAEARRRVEERRLKG